MIPSKTKIQSLLFCRDHYTVATAKQWAKKHGYPANDVDVKDRQIHLRQADPKTFEPRTIRTIKLNKTTNLQAVIGKPYVAVIGKTTAKPDNDAAALFLVIHKTWALHRKKHAIYASLARKKGLGTFEADGARRSFQPLVLAAAKTYRRDNKIRAKLSVIFPRDTVKKTTDKLAAEFLTYWNQGQLDQYLPRKVWAKRKEK